MEKITKKQNLLIAFILIAVCFRLIPHPPNFTPVTALALFSGTMFQKRWLSIIVPLLAMVLSDMILGFGMISLWVYAAFMLVTILGWFLNKMNSMLIVVFVDLHACWSHRADQWDNTCNHSCIWIQSSRSDLSWAWLAALV